MLYLALIGLLVCMIGAATALDRVGVPPAIGAPLGLIGFLAFTTSTGIWQVAIGPAIKVAFS